MNDPEREAFNPDDNKLELVGGALFPSDLAVQLRGELAQEQEFIDRYGNDEGVAELEAEVQAAQQALKDWNVSNPTVREYLVAIATWKQGYEPVLAQDVEDGKLAESKMRELEKTFGIQYSDITFMYYPADELKEKGYTDEQISVLHAISQGGKLETALQAHQTNVNRIKNLMKRRK